MMAQDDRRTRWGRAALWVALSVAGFFAAAAADHYVYTHWRTDSEDMELLYLFRAAGVVPVWLLVSAGMILMDSGRVELRDWREKVFRGGMLSLSAVGGGLATEALKLLLRRERPMLHDGHHAFRPFWEHTFSSSGLSLPSSHAAVAFAAAFMLCRLHPRGAPAWLAIALLCAAYRVLNSAHFLSDAYLSVFVGYGVAWLLWWQHHHNEATRLGNGPG